MADYDTAKADFDQILAKYAAAALQKQTKIVAQKQERKVKFYNKPPEERLSYNFVRELYQKTGITPARNIYWFYEDRARRPMIQGSYLDEETRKYGSPFGALVLLKAAELANKPDWVEQFTNTWVLGPISQLTGYSISYIQGFNAGFDAHEPGHRLCSYHFHCGYADGRIIAALLHKEGLLADIPSEDPWKKEDDDEVINELIRIKGYWRDEWGPKPPFLIDTLDLTEERSRELGII